MLSAHNNQVVALMDQKCPQYASHLKPAHFGLGSGAPMNSAIAIEQRAPDLRPLGSMSQQQVAHLNLSRPLAALDQPIKPAPDVGQLATWAQSPQKILHRAYASLPAVQASLPSKGLISVEQNLGQRVNYCTICNKELCNKYFMKTHMLKMHGINLHIEPNADSPVNNTTTKGEASPEEAQNGSDRVTGKRKFDSDNASQLKLAGISLGGVVCDICNKELCSKYFLKVHKQNTHGVDTDYHDLSRRLVFPLPQNDAHRQLNSAAPSFSQLGLSSPLVSLHPFDPQTSMYIQQAENSAKKMRLGSLSYNSQQQMGGGLISDPCRSQALNAFYKQILLAQGYNPTTSFVNDNLVPMMCSSGESDHSLSLLMRLMASKINKSPYEPVEPAKQTDQITTSQRLGTNVLSPALMVDLILKNQHVTENRSCKLSEMTDGDGMAQFPVFGQQQKIDAKTCKSIGSKSLNHYTEACPMCERKFKSIKWLKTHMLNDHKDELCARAQALIQQQQQQQQQTHPSRDQQVAIEAILRSHPQLDSSSFVPNTTTGPPELKHSQLNAFMQLQSVLHQPQPIQIPTQQVDRLLSLKQQLTPSVESNNNLIATDLSTCSGTKDCGVRASDTLSGRGINLLLPPLMSAGNSNRTAPK